MLHVKETATQLIITGPEYELSALVNEFKFRPSGYYYAVAYQQYQKSDGAEGWDGYIYSFKRVKEDMVIAPRGRKEDLFRYIEDEGIRLNTSGLLENPFTTLEIDDIRPDLIAGNFTLDLRQRNGILNWLREGIGINKISIGGGKTAMFCGAAAFIKERFPEARCLYITPSERLVRQSAKEMRRMLPQFDVGQCGGGCHEFEAKDMVVCTVAMLSKHFVGLLQDGWFETFMTLMIDECVTGDTLITKADGSQSTVFQIVEQGQPVWVKTFNETTGAVEDKLAFGLKRAARQIICIELEDGTELRCTPEHLLLTQRGWTEACLLRVGGCLHGYRRPVKVKAITPTGKTEEVYDLTVTDNHNYFANGILVHNCHHAASPTAKKILEAVPAYFRFGASDSTKEKDLGKFYAIRGLLGPKLTEVKSDPLIKEGRLAKPHIYIIDLKPFTGKFNGVEHRAPPDSEACVLLNGQWQQGVYRGPVYELDEDGSVKMREVKTAELDEDTNRFRVERKPIIVPGLHRIEIDKVEREIDSRWCLLDRIYDRAVIRFKSRNELIVKWTKFFSDKGWPTIVVATRTTHVYILEALLKKVIPRRLVRILTGYEKDSPEQRDAMFEWFKATPGAVLVTPLVREGISINEIRAMVVADVVADYEVARQILGRAMRPKGTDNRAHVAWFWDKQNKQLSQGCRQLLEHLETAEGFTYYHPCLHPEDVPELNK